MFQSIIDSTTGTLTLEASLICIGTALILGFVIALVYMVSVREYSRSFVITLVVIPILVETVILMTGGSLGTAVAVLGTFSLIRFRSAPGTASEIAGIFFAMAVGLTCGMGQIYYAALITVVVSAVFLVLFRSHFAEGKEGKRSLRVTIPEDLDYTAVFDDIFAKYTSSHRLDKVKTVNLGSLYELTYTVTIKNMNEEKKFLDEIRVRNGNLTVVCSRISELPATAL